MTFVPGKLFLSGIYPAAPGNYKFQITNYKQRGVLRTDFKRLRRGVHSGNNSPGTILHTILKKDCNIRCFIVKWHNG